MASASGNGSSRARASLVEVGTHPPRGQPEPRRGRGPRDIERLRAVLDSAGFSIHEVATRVARFRTDGLERRAHLTVALDDREHSAGAPSDRRLAGE
jgi:hypothetical protein